MFKSKRGASIFLEINLYFFYLQLVRTADKRKKIYVKREYLLNSRRILFNSLKINFILFLRDLLK